MSIFFVPRSIMMSIQTALRSAITTLKIKTFSSHKTSDIKSYDELKDLIINVKDVAKLPDMIICCSDSVRFKDVCKLFREVIYK